MIGWMKISRRQFYWNGGFADTRSIRVTRGKSWAYYERFR